MRAIVPLATAGTGTRGPERRLTPALLEGHCLPWPECCVLFLLGGTRREVEIGRETSSFLKCPKPSPLLEAESSEATRRSGNCFRPAAPGQQGCKWPAVGRDPRPESQRLPSCRGAAEAGGARSRQEQVSAGPLLLLLSLLPASRPEPLGVVFWKYFQALQQYPPHSLPLPPGAAVRAGKALAPNPAKLLLTCVLCVPQTFHSAVASEARNPC